MPKSAIISGMLLTLLGLIFYVFAVQLGAKEPSVTALIPTFLGVPLMLLGFFSVTNPALRMHLMHAAAMLAALGFLASAVRLVMVMVSKPNFGPGVIANLIMAIITAVFVVMCIQSFTAARRARQSNP